jgi:ATP-binding cassette subfamily F protein uup
MSVDSGVPSGKLVAELLNVTKGWPDADGVLRDVVHDFSAIILRGDKIGLIGPNGAGKTTLLKLILGEIQADSGSVRLGTQLQVAYFDQLRAHLDENRTVKDSIVPGGEWIEIGGKRKHVMSYLTDFLFAPERANSPVSSLSGGERNRLLLARLFARPANVLVLDEPTNDLDIDTLELLEDLLQEFDGTVFLVSHDRAFLDNVVTDTIAWEGPGAWREYVGGYEDWLRQRSTVATASTTPGASAEVTGDDRKTRRPIKLSFKEQRELDQIPDRLATLEVEQTALTARLNDPALYQTGAEELRKVTERAAKVELELTQLIERWEALEAKQAGPG